MLGRCENAKDVFITGQFDLRGIKCNQEAKKMTDVLDIQSSLTSPLWKEGLKIVLLNIRSINRHQEDLLNDYVVQDADVIFLTETWLPQNHCKNSPFSKHPFAAYASHGAGKGCAAFSKKSFHAQSIVEETVQLLKVHIDDIPFFLMYMSPNTHVSTSIEVLSRVFIKKSIVLGDFNTSLPNKFWTEFAIKNNMSQIVSSPTHDQGNILDQIYVSNSLKRSVSYFHHFVYFSDHDCLALCIKN